MVTMALLTLCLAAFLTLHIFSIRMNHITAVKLGASDQARDVISKLISDLRHSGDVKVGQGSRTSFVAPGTNQPLVGNAVMIYPNKTNTNVWIRYYWDASDYTIKRVASDDPNPRKLVEGITNRLVFSVEDFKGTILTNSNDKRVVGVTLQFNKLVFPSAAIGQGGLFDFYQVRTKVARRTVE
ncbi:MAG: hypothetical protein NZ739_09210 [Verrucomicrobiae bacterium]|nr:hypothetical protein [Verrucomicrobiae bacterium]MCX7721813.1 hypothetical protein [Verrucomicrobiae bacterium]MDW7980125.1 hypothetical protein [Verrucomicrobiales bacterium]